ncbi:MAG: hypothetical protein K2L57_00760, partial [Muribaculaceae bacterium]|nr:hypothetical protein [Muribaculaceae bacterium]
SFAAHHSCRYMVPPHMENPGDGYGLLQHHSLDRADDCVAVSNPIGQSGVLSIDGGNARPVGSLCNNLSENQL